MTVYERTVRWFERHRFGVDLAWTIVLALFLLLTAADVFATSTYDRSMTIGWSLAVIAPLPWRRTHPVPSAVAVYAIALFHLLVGFPIILPADAAVLVSLYTVTVYGPTWAHLTAMASTVVGCGVLVVAVGLRVGGADAIVQSVPFGLFSAVTGLAVWAFALVRRSRRVMLDALRDRNRRLEIERDQQARIATAAERARIAREMHDIVAHSLSIVVAQADGGRYAAASDPDAAVRSLSVIGETARAALADMRRLLGVLRSADDREAGTTTLPAVTSGGPALPVSAGRPQVSAPLAPQPDDADLETLVGQARDGGLRVSFVRVGTPRRLPPGAGLTLHRVCQEALTNVRKHAGPSPTVTVVLRWAERDVELEVSDDGRGAAAADGQAADPTSDAGYGLLGMRERAAMFGGLVTAGPRAGGGWRVRFTMPVPPASAAADQTGETGETGETGDDSAEVR